MTARQTNPSELQIALDNRAFEIQLFWQRSNYFIVLMTALGVGVFTIKSSKYALCISLFAAITSWYWYKTNLGSKFWQESWEVEVVKLAKEKGIRSFERPTSEIVDQVKDSLEAGWQQSGKGSIRKLIDRQILKKPSVSHYMILLSLTSVGLWTVISISYAADLFLSTPTRPRTPIQGKPVPPPYAISTAIQTKSVGAPLPAPTVTPNAPVPDVPKASPSSSLGIVSDPETDKSSARDPTAASKLDKMGSG